MARIYAFFIALLCTQSVVHAVGINDACVLGSKQCDANLYCQPRIKPNTSEMVYRCANCSQSYPYSDAGTDYQTGCYKKCGNKPNFENGTWKPDEPKIYYTGNDLINNDCQYKNTSNITCNNQNNHCDGYHLEVSGSYGQYVYQCVLNRKECISESHTGFQTYSEDPITHIFSWGDCFETTCSSDYHLENTKSMCGQTYGDCISNTQPCKSKLTCEGNNVTIEGNAYWKNDANAYDYSECTCDRIADLEYGTGTELCTWNGTTWSNCKRTLKTCKAGYWQGFSPNPTDCTQVTDGYYSADNELAWHPCPAGSTSAAGSDALTDCYMTGNQTVICDNNKCFQLPGGAGNIYYHGK